MADSKAETAAAPAPTATASATTASGSTDTKTAGSLKTHDAPPNPTIYVHGLNEKVKKEELKRSLYHVFSQFGNVLEVQAHKTYKLRGQAWVIFEDLSGATKAITAMANFNFYGRPMKVQFARVKSDVIAKADGSFVARPKRKVDGVKGADKKKKKATEKLEGERPTKKVKSEAKPSEGASASGSGGASSSAAVAQAAALMAGAMAEQLPPNRILFVENLPAEANEMMLGMLFRQYSGFNEVRLVPGKPGIAFVDFQDHFQSAAAMAALQGFKITPTHLMKISFARS